MSGERALAVVCVSGGMDSSVTAAIAASDHRLAFLHANYGQRTEAREMECFRLLADHFQAEHTLVVDFTGLKAIGGSSLTDESMPVREGDPEEGVVPSSYVPFRNAHLLAAATSWAEVLGATAIFVGAVWEDSSGLPGLPARVLPGVPGGHPPGDAARDAHRGRHARHRLHQGARSCAAARPWASRSRRRGRATRAVTRPAASASPAGSGCAGSPRRACAIRCHTPTPPGGRDAVLTPS